MKNVFITGVSGYIGSKIAMALSENEHVSTITGIDIREPDHEIDKLIFLKHDVRDSVADILKKYEIDTVIHAAYVLPPMHNTKLAEDINISGTRNILADSKKAGVSHILYTSSTTAYGFHPDNDHMLTENKSPLRGNNDLTYSKNKKEIESVIGRFIEDNPEIVVTILRPCFVVGPGFNNPLARHLKKKLVLLATQTSPMQFVHEDDLLEIIIMCLEKSIPGIFNVGGEGTISFPEMVGLMNNYPVYLPLWILKPLNGLAWNLRLKFLTEFPNPALNLMLFRWVASSEKLIKKTEYRYKYNSKQAFADFAKHVVQS